MSNEDDIRALEANIESASEFVDMGVALERLRNNRDFKKVVISGYLEKEAIRLVHLRLDPNMQTSERQALILRQIDGIGVLNDYFNTILQMVDRAKRSIASDEDTIQELRNGSDE